MKNLYAVYIAINEYVHPVNPLKGCVRDAMSLCKYINDRYEKQFQIHEKKIINSEATRANVIAAFEHFEAAKDGDVCLFYFAGHGSRMATPALFEHLEVDGKLETLVCYDSRSGSGDLIDKELSYLIWKATKGKEVHFVTIMDCCHSGSNMRGEGIIGERQTREVTTPKQVQDFLGFESYQEKQKGRWTPPSGKYIALSACLASQTAKEVYANQQPTGVFTYFLVEVLKETGGNIDYNSLVSKVNTKVGLFVKDQSPQLESEGVDKNLKFLSQTKWDGKKNYLVTYDKKLKRWVVNLGEIHGLKKGAEHAQTIFQLEEGQNIVIDEIFARQSTLQGIEESNRKKVLNAKLIQMGINRLKVGISSELTAEYIEKLQMAYQQDVSWFFELLGEKRSENYLIRSTEKGIGLYVLGSDVPLFEFLRDWNTEQVQLFLNRVNAVCRWSNLLQLNNPTTTIPSDAVELTFYRMTEANYDSDSVQKRQMDWRESIKLPYLDGNHCSAFQLKIKNLSDRPLWMSALYLQRNFAIHNNLLTKSVLAPQEEQWLEVIDGNYRSHNIEIQIEEEFLVQGITEIKEYLKLLVSTHEFNTEDYVQDALPQEGSQRSGVEHAISVYGDWRSYELGLVIRYS